MSHRSISLAVHALCGGEIELAADTRQNDLPDFLYHVDSRILMHCYPLFDKAGLRSRNLFDIGTSQL